jgi:hypothetical protein
MNLKYFILAHHLNKEYKEILLKNCVHFRGNEGSMSMISISEEKPELGVPKCSYKKYTEGDIRNEIEQDINKIKNEPKPRRLTPEKNLQAWIIKHALNNDYKLPFDNDITFITSELAIENEEGRKIVTDILGYDKSSNRLCIIELKSDRQLTRLIEQVNRFEELVKEKMQSFSNCYHYTILS